MRVDCQTFRRFGSGYTDVAPRFDKHNCRLGKSKNAKIPMALLQKMHRPCAKLAHHFLAPNRLSFIVGVNDSVSVSIHTSATCAEAETNTR